MKRKALFRMTLKRKLMLEGIITTINIKWESVTGFARLLIDEIPDPEKKARRHEENVKEEEKWSLVHDVLEVVISHHDDFLLELHMKEKRNWKNEWDVPDEVFKQAIQDVIALLTWYEEHSVIMKPPGSKKRYEERIEFLEELLAFRMAG